MDVFSLTKHKCNEKNWKTLLILCVGKCSVNVNHFACCSQSV